MDLKSNLLAAITSMAWVAAPAAWSQEPPMDSPPTSPDATESQSPAEDMDQGAPAEDPSTAGTRGPSTSDATAVDDKKLDQFANAYMQVQTIQQKAASDLQSSSDPAAADEVKAKAENDMIAAVERSGLKVEEFNQIVQSMASNVELRNRVAAKLQQRSGG
jgi:hypothetical protein